MQDDVAQSKFAVQACAACRKQKRRCDKQLPSCTLCLRNGRPCHYTSADQDRDVQQNPSVEDFRALRQRVVDLEATISHSRVSADGSTGLTDDAPATTESHNNTSFPSLLFVDAWAFSYGGHQVPVPRVRVPPGALESLGSSADLRVMIEEYFATVHVYFPIISKVRLFQILSDPNHEPGGDYLLLFMAIKLITTDNPGTGTQAAQTQLYRAAKSLYVHVESQNGFTIHTLQALLLIAMYELGNAIWPAAYLTTGACARLGHALGVHSRDTVPMLQRPQTWTEQEERRRVAWAMFVLDRYANAGHHHRPFACEDPSLNDILPTDDGQWDRGQMGMTAPLALSASQITSVSAFARLCQASHILSKVIRHTNNTDAMTPEFLSEEALQLEATVRALLEALHEELSSMGDEEITPFFAAVALCLTASMSLYDKYSCSTSLTANVSELQLQVHKRSIAGIADIIERSYFLAQRIRLCASELGLSKISPLVIDCLYSAASTYAWYVRESSDQASHQRLQEMKEILGYIDARWKSAGESIRIVESTEFHLNGV